MELISKSLVCCLFLMFSQLVSSVTGLELSVSTSGGNESSSILYGLMFEVYYIISLVCLLSLSAILP